MAPVTDSAAGAGDVELVDGDGHGATAVAVGGEHAGCLAAQGAQANLKPSRLSYVRTCHNGAIGMCVPMANLWPGLR